MNHNMLFLLFRTFGELKGLRMPKKMVGTGTHRGFAFVEYNSKTEAKAAMESLCQSTHLYGRRLVLEWAQAGENLDEMRKRTADQLQTLEGKICMIALTYLYEHLENIKFIRKCQHSSFILTEHIMLHNMFKKYSSMLINGS